MSTVFNFFSIYNTLIVAGGAPGGGGGEEGGGGGDYGFGAGASGPSPIPEPTANTTIYYVSDSDGDDANDGLSIANPKKTLSAGLALLNANNGDYRLLLKRGDTFFEQDLDAPNKVGASGAAPMVIGAYGSGNRPIITPSSGNDLMTLSGGGGRPEIYSNWALSDLDIYASTRDPDSVDYAPGTSVGGLSILRGMENFTIYNCAFRFCTLGISIIDFDDFGQSGVLIQDCDFLDSWQEASIAHSQGMYFEGTNTTGVLSENITIKGCIFDHCGWNETAPDAQQTVFNHDLYIQSSQSISNKITISGCAFTRASANGIQLRPGGTIVDCLFLDNPISALIGGGTPPLAGGVTGVINGSIIMGTNTIDGADRGWGVDISNDNDVQVTNCIVANIGVPAPSSPFAYWDNGSGTMFTNVKEYEWASEPPHSSEYSGAITGVFNDPTRTYIDFDSSLGGSGTVDSFYGNFRARASGYSIGDVLTYLGNGFNIV